MNQAKPTRIRYAEVVGRFEQQMDQSDQLRTDSLKNLQRIREAKRNTLDREYARLSSKLGNKHPRTLRASEKLAGNQALWIFALAVVFVFLVLSAQYESWMLPLAIILIVPLCLLAAITGVLYRGMDNNILTQVGLVVLSLGELTPELVRALRA